MYYGLALVALILGIIVLSTDILVALTSEIIVLSNDIRQGVGSFLVLLGVVGLVMAVVETQERREQRYDEARHRRRWDATRDAAREAGDHIAGAGGSGSGGGSDSGGGDSGGGGGCGAAGVTEPPRKAARRVDSEPGVTPH